MLSNSFHENYVLVGPQDAGFTLGHEKSEEKTYYLGVMYGYHHETKERCLAGASEKGYLGVVKYLMSQGANVHASHALAWASEHGHLKVVKYLVSQGADVHADDDYVLELASYNGHLEVVKHLISQGMDVGRALVSASCNGHLEVVKYSIGNVEAGTHTSDEDYALGLASQNGHLEVVKCLIEAGADVHEWLHI